MCPDPYTFETSLWPRGCALGVWSCREALVQSSHLSLAASKKRWGETGPAGDGVEASPLLPQLESLEMLRIQKKQLEVNGSHESKGNLRTSGLGLQAWGWSLLQECLGAFRCPWMSAKMPARLGCYKQHCQLPGDATFMGVP